jgi:hypothetical protein
VRDRVDREMTRETGQRDQDGMRREQASYRPTHYGMRAQDHGALLASLARKVNAFVDSHFRAGTPILKAMPRKPIELPPAVARAFVRDMNAYFAETNLIKRDEIAIRQLVALNEYLGRRERPLRVTDVKAMFLQMRDQA